MDLMVEVSPRRVFANAHTYHVNSISVNSDYETYMSADDLRINLWHLDITDRSFSILCGLWCMRIVIGSDEHSRFQTNGQQIINAYVHSIINPCLRTHKSHFVV